jgi:Ni/Co efflux regulator RcnB
MKKLKYFCLAILAFSLLAIPAAAKKGYAGLAQSEDKKEDKKKDKDRNPDHDKNKGKHKGEHKGKHKGKGHPH